MKIQIVTLFPEIFEGVFNTSMMHKAKTQGAFSVEFVNLRDFGVGPRKQVDDAPYGGGDGMLLMPEPLFKAVKHAKSRSKGARVYLMTPRGKTLKQAQVKAIADDKHDMIIICGRYEGYDERITELVDEQLSVGDYVLTGGEIPAMILVDSVVRLIPGVLGGETSAEKESFTDEDIVEHPQYTRPAEFNGLKVPEVLLNGNHSEIDKWRKDNSISSKK